jgi:hypothetical protein
MSLAELEGCAMKDSNRPVAHLLVVDEDGIAFLAYRRAKAGQ